MLSSPLGQYILDYDLPHGFSIPIFTIFDGFTNPYDHMLHYNQATTLNAGNDWLLYKVFLTSLRHKLPRYSINSFNELWAAFILWYLCSVWKKRNINSLQAILKQEEETIRDFTRRFGQAVQQIESYNMDAILQNFRRNFRLSTPFFQSLSLNPPVTMEELYRQANKYSMLEDNIYAITQTVMITNQPAEGNKPSEKKSSESKEG